MRSAKWREQLRALVNSHGVDTELDAPDWILKYASRSGQRTFSKRLENYMKINCFKLDDWRTI